MKLFTIFDEGPFWAAHKNATQFGMGLYFIQCMEQSILEHDKAQKEYAAALLLQDEQIIAQKKGQLDYYEGILILAGQLKEPEEMI